MQLRLQGISLKIKASLLPIFSNSRGSKYPEAARSRCTKLLYSSQCASFAGSSCPYALFFLSLLFNIFFPVDLVITVCGAERGKYTEGGSWQSREAAREALLPSHDITCTAIGGTAVAGRHWPASSGSLPCHGTETGPVSCQPLSLPASWQSSGHL